MSLLGAVARVGPINGYEIRHKLVQILGISGLSKSQVSVMARELDEHVEQFRI